MLNFSRNYEEYSLIRSRKQCSKLLEYGHFKECQFDMINFEGRFFSNIYIASCAFFGGNGSSSRFRDCTFRDVEFYDSRFWGAKFYRCSFIDTRFGGVTLNRSKFEKCSFENTHLIKDNLSTGCSIEGVILKKCFYKGLFIDDTEINPGNHRMIFPG